MEKVTAGIPALTPGLRASITKARENREQNSQRLRDHVVRESETTAPDDTADVTSLMAQMGRPMAASEIKRRLMLCNPSLHFEISIHDSDKTGIYVIRNLDKVFVCGMQSGISPEFSVRLDETRKVPHPDNSGDWKEVKAMVKEIRGWRTVLAMLLRGGLITQAQIDHHFAPGLGRSSKNWQQATT